MCAHFFIAVAVLVPVNIIAHRHKDHTDACRAAPTLR